MKLRLAAVAVTSALVAGSANRNSSHTIYQDGTTKYSLSVTGSAMSGTWRACGVDDQGGGGFTLMQRIA